jgi:hypothetical protein
MNLSFIPTEEFIQIITNNDNEGTSANLGFNDYGYFSEDLFINIGNFLLLPMGLAIILIITALIKLVGIKV